MEDIPTTIKKIVYLLNKNVKQNLKHFC